MEKFYKRRILINQIGKYFLKGIIIFNIVFLIEHFNGKVEFTWQLGLCIFLFNIILFSLMDSFNDCIDEYRKLLRELQNKDKPE